MKPNMRGFSLIEVMIVVVIVGILASIAYPSYREYVLRGNRTEGQALLSEATAAQERYYAQNNQYVTATNDLGKLGLRSSTATGITSETGKYTLSASSSAGDGGYTLTATQTFNDTGCGNLTLNAMGERGNSGSRSVAECWR